MLSIQGAGQGVVKAVPFVLDGETGRNRPRRDASLFAEGVRVAINPPRVIQPAAAGSLRLH